ncbi:MAG: prepilin-type N-terminal cleavage/methylation domain-containing protein [Candidatus Omnitrophota bacterium]
MKKVSGDKKASTLVEVLISIAIVLIFLVAAVNTIFNAQFLTSYSKHRLQAMYVAQRIIEQERRLTFGNIVSQASTAWTLDTNGTYNTTADDFLGNAIITVISWDAYRKQVQVQVNWQERILAGKVTMREYYATIIANDPLSN